MLYFLLLCDFFNKIGQLQTYSTGPLPKCEALFSFDGPGQYELALRES